MKAIVGRTLPESGGAVLTVYAIAQLSITDLTAYRRNQSRFADVFHAFDGTLLAADESPKVEEGSWPHQKVVLLAFPDEQALRVFADSPEYAAIAADRRAGTDGVVLTVHGVT